jgi:hypothetical protein
MRGFSTSLRGRARSIAPAALLGAVALSGAVAAPAANAATITKSLVNTCKLYQADGVNTGASISLGLKITARIPDDIPQGGTGFIREAKATATLSGPAVGIAHAFGDQFSGQATAFNIALTNATPTTLNPAATPIPVPTQVLPVKKADGTYDSMSFDVPTSGFLPDIGPLTASGPAGSTIVATFPYSATALVTDINFSTLAEPTKLTPYQLRCRPDLYLDDDETIKQDLTLGSAKIADPITFSPTHGPLSGGTLVTVKGVGLSTVKSVTAAGKSIPFTQVSPTEITIVTPPWDTPGPIEVRGDNADGYITETFTYDPDPVTPPTVTGLTPNHGPLAGGTSVTIAGTGLAKVSGVTVGGKAATLGAKTATSVVITTPAGTAAGSAPVVVTNPDGTATSSFTYDKLATPPTVSGLTPNHGTVAGGTSVSIAGTNLDSVTSVTVGGKAATVGAKTATSVTITTPAGTAAGAATVVVTNPDGTASGSFTYDRVPTPPTVTGLNPNHGAFGGGTSVTISGTNLDTVSGVTVGGKAATLGAKTATSVVITTPATTAAGAAAVVVTNPDGTATSSFTYDAKILNAPTVSGLTPNHGPLAGGTSVTIAGTNLDTVSGVTVGGKAATLGAKTATSLTITTPAGAAAGAAAVVVTNPDGAGSSSFTYDRVATPPTVTGLTPNHGALTGGTSVIIAGTNLDTVSGVTVGGKAATLGAKTATSVAITTPAGAAAGSAPVVVTNPDGTASSSFTYDPKIVNAPTVTSIAPNHGPLAGGNATVITGTNLDAVTSVTIGGKAATLGAKSATSLTVTVPAATTAGAATVSVTNPDGSATSSYTYDPKVVNAPTASKLAPDNGDIAGGTSVTVTGTNLDTVTSVTVAGKAATVSTKSATSLTFATPSAAAAGAATVTITNPDGFATATFTYTSKPVVTPPTISALDPTHGPAAGGTVVTITGAHLTGATGVKFGSASATGVTVVSDTSVKATAPAGTAGATVAVSVTTADGTSGTQSYKYDEVVPVAPKLTALSPTHGAAAGGNTVTLTGTALTGATVVKFGTKSATDVKVVSATSVTAVVPSGTAGSSVEVSVTTPAGTSNTASYKYDDVIVTPTGVPTISRVISRVVIANFGGFVVVQGKNFKGITSAKIGTKSARVSVITPTLALVTLPAQKKGSYPLVLTNAAGAGPALNISYVSLF